MKLEYLNNISDGGKFKQVVSDNLIRLYDFDESQTTAFAQAINQTLIVDKQMLNLSIIKFIEPQNCSLVLQLSLVDKGILRGSNENTFVCHLTEQSYAAMIQMVKSYSQGYHWLCDTSAEDIDFLYSAGGTW